MAIYDSIDTLQLSNLLRDIDHKRMALPDFQRSYVWKPAQVEELLASVCQDFPVGTILRVRNSDNLQLGQLRHFQGSPEIEDSDTDVEFVVLDGQQRLTSLYAALHGTGSHSYFFDLSRYRDSGDLADSILSGHRTRRLARGLEDVESQYEQLILPFAQFHNFSDWKTQARRYLGPNMTYEEVNNLEDFLNEVDDSIVNLVQNYRLPVLTLSREVTLNGICTIFETINRTGTRLGLFDLLTARFRIDNIFLREEWEATQRNHPELEKFEVDPFHLLRAVSAIVSRNHTVTRQDVLDLTGDDFRDHWKNVASEMAWVLQVFQDECGLSSPKWLPYEPMLVAPTAVLVDFGHVSDQMRGVVRQKLKRWFFASALESRYEHGATSRISHDFKELALWFAGGDTPEWIDRFTMTEEHLETATSLQSASYKAALCYYLSQGPRDLENGEPIRSTLVRAGDVQDHHVFPKGYLRKSWADSKYSADTVLNRILIRGTTNRRIGSRPPSAYLSSLRDGLTSNGVNANKFNEILRSHMLPAHDSGELSEDDFELFIKNRRDQLFSALNETVRGIAIESPIVAD